MADGSFPFSTIPGLPPASNVGVDDEIWISQGGLDRRAKLSDIVGLAAGGSVVTSVSSADSNLTVTNPTSTPLLTVQAAPRWSSPRSFSFTGDVSGVLANVDGSANVSGALSLASIVGAGTFGSANQVPRFTIDATGRITAAANVPIAPPVAVTQVSSTTGDLTVVNPTTTPALTVVSAPKWSIPRIVNFTGDVTGTNTVDGSTNVTTPLTLASVNAAPGTYGDATHIPAVTVNAKGLVTGVALIPTPAPATGTVTSVGLTAPPMFTVTGSPVTSAGNLGLALASQPQSTFLGAPNGAAGVPSFRALTTQDLPPGTGTVTSVGLTMPALFSVAGSPVTSAGSLAVSIPNQGQNTVWAGPASGGNGQPTFRVLTAADLPPATGTVTSIGLAMPAPFTVVGTNPITTNGNFTVTTQVQNANLVWAGPATGTPATPTFRALTAADIPSLSGSYLPLAGGTVTGATSFNAGITVTQNNGGVVAAGAAGFTRGYLIYTGASPRWWINANATAETGSNAGSDFVITGYSDTGTSLGSYLTINRATGNVTLPNALSVGGNATFTGSSVLIDPPATDAGLTLSKPASGNVNYIYGDTNNLKRWRLDLGDGTAESGANAGSNLVTYRYSDTGAFIDNPLTINRATGLVTVNGIIGGGLAINSPTVAVRQLSWDTGGLQRYVLQAGAAAESGGNAGSNFAFAAYDDTGAFLFNYFTCNRQSGVLNLGAVPGLPSQAAASVFAAPAGAAGVPSFRALTSTDVFPIQAQNLVFASPVGGTGAPTFRQIQATDFAPVVQQNRVLAGLPTAGTTSPTFRLLVGADLPAPAAASLGGVQSLAAVANQFMTGISTAGVPTTAQPATTNLSDFVARTTFTPTVSFATPGDSTFAYTTQTGAYVKIGPMVFFWIFVSFTPTFTTAGSNLQCSLPPGLPVTDPSGSTGWAWSVRQFSGPTWPTGGLTLIARTAAASLASFFVQLNNGSVQALSATQVTSGLACSLAFSGYYF